MKVCCTCDKTFSEIPEGSQQLTFPKGGNGHKIIWKFPNGEIHVLKKVKAVQSIEEKS
jgi:hypothetical protein